MKPPRLTRLLCAAVLTSLLCACGQSAFYYPDRVLYQTPDRAGLRFEKTLFPSADGTKLSGWFIPAAGYADPRAAKATVIQFHGNAQNMSSHWQFVSWLPARGFNVFVFDYRGYGESAGSPEPKGVYEDSMAALNYVRARNDVDPERLLVLGQSLGGTNAIAAVGSGNRAGVKGVVIEATFYSYSSIAHEKFSGAGFLMEDNYSAERYVAGIAPIPLLFIHGTADAVVPYAHSLRLMDKAKAPKRLITIEGGGHLDALSKRYGDKYQNALAEFFEAALEAK